MPDALHLRIQIALLTTGSAAGEFNNVCRADVKPK
jgi:hypothetical protein